MNKRWTVFFCALIVGSTTAILMGTFTIPEPTFMDMVIASFITVFLSEDDK